MSKKTSLETFIQRANKIHNNKYNYSLVFYQTALLKVIIICPFHGEFQKSPNKHVSRKQGCPQCSRIAKNEAKIAKTTPQMFMKKANKKHNFKYMYDLMHYQGSKKKIAILCNIHGVFYQQPRKHLFGDGCPKCGNLKIAEKARNNPTGWSYSNWKDAAKVSKNFESFKVYIIKCWNDNEEFYKVGKTFLELNMRFRNKKALPYNYKIINIYTGSAIEMCELEKELKTNNKDHLYVPKIKFNGMYECFRKII